MKWIKDRFKKLIHPNRIETSKSNEKVKNLHHEYFVFWN